MFKSNPKLDVEPVPINEITITEKEENKKESYYFMIPYSDAFEFANITEDISQILKKNKIDPFIHTEKVKIHKHKQLGVSQIYKYGVVVHAYKQYASILDYYFKNQREYTVITEDAMLHKHVIPIICERDHSMNDLIRKK